MGDVELVIKIPEELLSEIDDENYQSVISWYDTSLYCAIKDSTPLPKGHGRIGDLDKVKSEMLDSHDIGAEIETYGTEKIIIDIFNNVPTLIEADKPDYEKDEVEK